MGLVQHVTLTDVQLNYGEIESEWRLALTINKAWKLDHTSCRYWLFWGNCVYIDFANIFMRGCSHKCLMGLRIKSHYDYLRASTNSWMQEVKCHANACRYYIHKIILYSIVKMINLCTAPNWVLIDIGKVVIMLITNNKQIRSHMHHRISIISCTLFHMYILIIC